MKIALVHKPDDHVSCIMCGVRWVRGEGAVVLRGRRGGFASTPAEHGITIRKPTNDSLRNLIRLNVCTKHLRRLAHELYEGVARRTTATALASGTWRRAHRAE